MAVTSNLLNYLRQQFVAKADHAQYKIGGTYTNAPLNEKKVSASGTVTFGFYITATTGTVTECRILDASNNVLASKSESIALAEGASAVYYFFTYSLYELTS